MISQKHILIILVLVLILATALLVNTTLIGKSIFQKEDIIKVGSLLILSGDGSAWGQASQRGIELAINEVNQEGGVNGKMIEMVYEDTSGDIKKAVSGYKKLVDIDDVVSVIGPLLQAEMVAILPLANEGSIPIFAPSYAPLSNRPNPKNPLMIWLDPTFESEQMAEYAYSKGMRSVSVLGTKDSWEEEVSTAFAEKFEDLGGEVHLLELTQPGAIGVRTTVTKAISKNPDAVYLGTYYQFLNFGRILNELGYEGQIYSIEIDEYLASESKGYSSGIEFISSDSYKDEFREEYELAYGEKSNMPAGQSYDAAKILVSFLEKSTDSSEIVDMMKDFNSYNGVSGQITITEDGRTLMPTAIYLLDEGEIKKIKGL